MTKPSGGIVAVGKTVDFSNLDDPSHARAALVKAGEEVLHQLQLVSFDDRGQCYSNELPHLLSSIKDLHLSIDFLRTPSSKGKMPSGTESFQTEVSSNFRALSAFLSFPQEHLTFADWNSLGRSLSTLALALQLFIEKFGE